LPRQLLLVGTTALVVARPLVLGEDPGLLSRPISDSAGLVISLLWLVLALGWAVWRLATQQGTWYASIVDLALVAVTGLVFLSAGLVAPYKHPAWLIAWEWLILILAFCLVRQLATGPDERRGFLAVLLATGVMLSALAVYQYVVELPRDRANAQNPIQLRQKLAEKFGVFVDPDDPQADFWRDRLLMNHAFASYANPNSFAGFLALLLPIGVGWAVAAWRRDRQLAMAVWVVLLAVALWLTHSRGAILAVLIVGLAVAAVRWRAHWRRHLWAVAAGLAGVVVLVVVVARSIPETGRFLQLARESMDKRLEYWAGSWRMIRTHVWLGVGPGNFGRLYPRYMAADALEKVQEPHNFALETWATCGLFALVALLAALALFFWKTRAAWVAPEPATSEEGAKLGAPRWEFYVGGMLGLVLAFVLRVVGGMTQDEIIYEGAKSGLGSLLWFAAFYWFEGTPWPGPSQVLALVAGVAALLINLCVSGGMFFPSVAQPLWIVAALALAPIATARTARRWVAIALPLPLVAAACYLYFSTEFYPVMRSSSFLSEARVGQRLWFDRFEPGWRDELNVPNNQLRATDKASNLLNDLVLKPLEAAAEADPFDSYTRVQLAYWYGARWRLFTEVKQFGAEAQRQAVEKMLTDFKGRAFWNLEQAWKVDPDGLDAYAVDYQLLKAIADAPGRAPQERNALYADIAGIVRRMLERDPHDAQLRYSLADILFSLGNGVDGRREARRALERDDRLRAHKGRGLNAKQRKQAEDWLAAAGG
jgi:hypothetical protein